MPVQIGAHRTRNMQLSVLLVARARALAAFLKTDDGTTLVQGFKRAANILKKEGVEAAAQIALSYTPEVAEKALIDALDAAGPKASAAVGQEDFAAAMAALPWRKLPRPAQTPRSVPESELRPGPACPAGRAAPSRPHRAQPGIGG